MSWVKGHHDIVKEADQLSNWEALNCIVDHVANLEFTDPAFPSRTVSDAEVLPAEKWALYIMGEKIVTKAKADTDSVPSRCTGGIRTGAPQSWRFWHVPHQLGRH